MNPNHTALLLIGYQNDYFASDGILSSVIEESATATNTVANTVKLLQSLVKTPTLMIATPIFFTHNYEELVEPVGILSKIKAVGAFQEGTKGAQTIEALAPFQTNILEVPGKRGLNAFVNTNLSEVLQQRNITHLVLAGAVTSVCIDSTGRSAYEQGYQVSILSDCTSARTRFEQDFYFENVFPLYAKTLTSTAFLAQLEAAAI
ncbi:MAG: cysteine hydrolase family protein [Cyanobacteria bacterium J06638_28]